MIDLRSDTVTQPCQAMRKVMAEAPVGDDVIDQDPTVDRLQKMLAEMLGKEIAVFMPSGTMTNQVAVRLHCKPGDELLCEAGCHIFKYEQGGFAQLSGVVANPIHAKDHLLTVADLQQKISPDDDHYPETKLVCLENTHNRGGGRVMPYQDVQAICDWAHENNLRTHLDGARFFNAVVSSGIAADQWAKHFDTISICFSKGLGAPVGSALVGSQAMLREIKRHRKLFGGGMRQSGILAAAAIYALENNIDRLNQDHQAAQTIADTIRNCETLQLAPKEVDTNIVIFEVQHANVDAAEFCRQLKSQGVWALPFSNRHVRVVTHKDVSIEECIEAASKIQKVAIELS